MTVNNMATDGGFHSHRSTMSDYQRTDQSALSSSRGWGKQAAQRLNTKDQFKNDPLLRTLEGKMAVNFGDYKPWQRTTLSRFPRESQARRKSPSRPMSGLTTVSVGSGPGFAREESMKIGPRPYSAATSTACSTVCNHPWTKKPQIVDDAEERRKLNVLSILKVFSDQCNRGDCQDESPLPTYPYPQPQPVWRVHVYVTCTLKFC